MNPYSRFSPPYSLVGCTRTPLTLAQTRIIEQQNPGCAVGPLRNGDRGPAAIVRKVDGSIWMIGFTTETSDKPYAEEEIIPAPQPKP